MNIHYYAYELIATAFLFVVAVSYWRKNWLDLRINYRFQRLLSVAIFCSLLDVLSRWLATTPVFENIHAAYAILMYPCISMILLKYLLFDYFCVLTGRLENRSEIMKGLMFLPAIVVSVLVLSTPWTKLFFYIDKAGVFHYGRLMSLMGLISMFYMVAICVLLWSSLEHISYFQALLWTGLFLVHLILVVLQYYVFSNRYLLVYFSEDILILVCYLLYQNLDRYADKVSGGFSRAGLRKVLDEKFRYREKFCCLFVTLQNYQNIVSICDEKERDHIMGEIGGILKFCGGKRSLYHIHGSDFAVIQKREDETLALYEQVYELLPDSIRVHDKTVNLNYCFYMLTLDEAAYNRSEFYKMFTSMKKLSKKQTDSGRLMRYEGEVKRAIEQELQIGRQLKKIMSSRRCDICFYPVIDAEGHRHALEGRIYMLEENGKMISEDAIWAVAKDMGYLRELGRIALESILEQATKEDLFIHGFRKLAINVTPLQICSESIVRDCRFLAKKYQFPLHKLCMELTEDMSANFEMLEKYLGLLKEEGVSLILDGYGENVCNLQGIMKMPFKVVKISSRMIQTYCSGESDILKYQVQMLRDNGWEICMAGIDNKVRYDKVAEMSPDYLQGEYYCRPLTPDRLHGYMEEK